MGFSPRLFIRKKRICLLLENLKRFPDVLFCIKCFVLKHLILPFLSPPHYRPA